MKKMIQSMALVGMMVGSSAVAGSFVTLSYANVSDSGSDSVAGVSFNTGLKFGEKFKNRLGMEMVVVTTDDWTESVGNMIGFYYSLGYEVLEDFSVGANIGYGFESIGTIGSGSSSVDVYATGLSYGPTLTYEISKHFEVVAEYKMYALDYEGVSYDRDVATVGLGYMF